MTENPAQLPYDGSAEAAVLGSALLEPRAVDTVIAALDADDFHVPRHELIYDAILELHTTGAAVDQLTVGDRLTEAGLIAKAGGREYLSQIVTDVPTTTNVDYYAGIVSRLALRRRVIRAGSQLQQVGATGAEAAIVELAQQIVDDATRSREATKVRFVGELFPELLRTLDEPEGLFIPTPWPSLNNAIGGLRPGAMYVVAARPGVGKSVVAQALAGALAEHGNVAFSSLEMGAHELVARIAADRLSIMVGRFKDRRLTDHDFKAIAEGMQTMAATRIAIDDRSSIALADVRQFARVVRSKPGGLVGIVVDYLQLFSSRGNAPRQEQVSEISRGLKILAKDLGVPVIALSQLNRGVEDRADGIPRLSDLRESGAIEQDADVVMMLRREPSPLRFDARGRPAEDFIIDVVKNRHGRVGEMRLAWMGEFSRVVEWDHPGTAGM